MVSCVIREEKGLALNIYATNFDFLFKVARELKRDPSFGRDYSKLSKRMSL